MSEVSLSLVTLHLASAGLEPLFARAPASVPDSHSYQPGRAEDAALPLRSLTVPTSASGTDGPVSRPSPQSSKGG
jgi:hypothetical protein